MEGLSPRVRGNRTGLGLQLYWPGPIPARAGQPLPWRRRARPSRAYPRACGATRYPEALALQLPGLSPRVRGNRRYRQGHHPLQGPIPARAGQPLTQFSRFVNKGAYPRACGATKGLRPMIRFAGGLSPRVRGNRHAADEVQVALGPIPARAGQPGGVGGVGHDGGAYPRACGATCAAVGNKKGLAGLSPRVRGNQSARVASAGARGPIPARAGQPKNTGTAPTSMPAYPRACGATMRRAACNVAL